MNRFINHCAIASAMLLTSSAANAQVFIKYGDIPGGSAGGGEWFIADSFSFGVEREMKESGEKGGTQDINIGIGELQELTIGKSMDLSSPKLAKLALTGGNLGTVDVCVTDNPKEPTDCYLEYKLQRVFIKSWSTSGDADDRPTEEVAFYYNKIAFSYAITDDGPISWNRKRKRPWPVGERLLSD